MISILALAIGVVALAAAVGLGAGAARRERAVREQGARLDELENGADLAVRDLRADDGALRLTLVNIGRGECFGATLVAATHGSESAPVEVGSLPPVRLGHPGTIVEIPTGALGDTGAHALWLRLSVLDALGAHRRSLRIAPEALARTDSAPAGAA